MAEIAVGNKARALRVTLLFDMLASFEVIEQSPRY
jgi:hypothetical protein